MYLLMINHQGTSRSTSAIINTRLTDLSNIIIDIAESFRTLVHGKFFYIGGINKNKFADEKFIYLVVLLTADLSTRK